MERRFGQHETLDLHEIAVFKSVCTTKSKTMQILVTDPALKAILHEDALLSNRQLEELNGLLANAIQ